MISRRLRRWCGWVLEYLAGLLGDTGVTPGMLSWSGLIVMAVAGLAFAQGRMLAAAALVLVGGGLDALDGEVARVTSTTSEAGAFIDSVSDHLGDLAIYVGLAWRAVAIEASAQVLLLLVASFGSLFGSLVRARATSFNMDLKDIGFITRFERLLILFLGSLLNRIEPALLALAVLANISAFQRLLFVALRSDQAIGGEGRKALLKPPSFGQRGRVS